MIYTTQDVRREGRQNMRGGNGVVVLEHLLPDALPANVRLYARITLKPGSSIGKHSHEGETEIFTFLNGAGKVDDDGLPVNVRPGFVMSTGNGRSHSVENTGDEDLVFLACIVLG